jgi:hypothetical protein
VFHLDNLDICQQHNDPFYEIDGGCTHPALPSTDDCDIRPTLPVVESISLDPPMYVKFTYREEW